MLQLALDTLPQESASRLASLQHPIDCQLDHATRVAAAQREWKRRPPKLFETLRNRLATLCTGNTRCVYCEDSFADEIEHMRPKAHFPEQCFNWHNFVLACGPCNGPKNSGFGVLTPGGELIALPARSSVENPVPPETLYALIDPRAENPLDLLWLDWDTFRYAPNTDDNQSHAWKRAMFTIELLRLNKRDALVRGRRSAFSLYLARLQQWQTHHAGWTHEQRLAFIDDFRSDRYRSVWERMKRFSYQHPKLESVALALEAVPEAHTW